MLLQVIVIYMVFHALGFYVLSRLLVPFLGFQKTPLPAKLPREMQKKIGELKKTSKDKDDFTKRSFMFLTKRYKSLWFVWIMRPDILFLKDLDKIYRHEHFLPCNSHNHLLRIFLVKSGYYDDSQIEVRHCLLNFGIHQYLRIHEKDHAFDLDLWGHNVGVPYGKHASIFKSASLITDITEGIVMLRKIRSNR